MLLCYEIIKKKFSAWIQPTGLWKLAQLLEFSNHFYRLKESINNMYCPNISQQFRSLWTQNGEVHRQFGTITPHTGVTPFIEHEAVTSCGRYNMRCDVCFSDGVLCVLFYVIYIQLPWEDIPLGRSANMWT